MAPKIVLGTAQFAGRYGALADPSHNRSPGQVEALTILREAEDRGISVLDTAPVYGDSEAIVGAYGWSGRVWSKLDPDIPPEQSLRRSLHRMRRSKIDVLFVHDLDRFLKLDESGVSRIAALRGPQLTLLGVSVYEPEELVEALSRIDFDVIQFPVNPFDTRFKDLLQSGGLPLDRIYAGRSVFLQGLLAQPAKALTRGPETLRPALRRWRDRCAALGVAPGAAALSWVLAEHLLDYIVVGADSAVQLAQVFTWIELCQKANLAEQLEAENLWPASDPRTWFLSRKVERGDE